MRRGAPHSIIRAETLVEGRTVSIDAEITAEGRSRTLVNGQTVRRRSELHQALRTTVFSPEEIGVVRAGPAERRRFLDETLAVIDPKAARAAEDLDRVLRQRGALLRNNRRTLSPEVATTLDVWDTRLDQVGTALVEARETLAIQLAPTTSVHYSRLAGREIDVGLAYRRSWSGRLDEALSASRRRRPRPGGHADRTAPRRTGAHAGRPSQPHPRITRRAAIPGPGPPAGRPSAGHRAARLGSSLAPGRRVLGARPLPSPSPVGRPPSRPGPVDHGAAGPTRGLGGQGLRAGPRGPGGPGRGQDPGVGRGAGQWHLTPPGRTGVRGPSGRRSTRCRRSSE